MFRSKKIRELPKPQLLEGVVTSLELLKGHLRFWINGVSVVMPAPRGIEFPFREGDNVVVAVRDDWIPRGDLVGLAFISANDSRVRAAGRWKDIFMLIISLLSLAVIAAVLVVDSVTFAERKEVMVLAFVLLPLAMYSGLRLLEVERAKARLVRILTTESG